MKIQLEQKNSHCPDHMTCVACAKPFKVGSLRHLLTDNQAMILGDLCHNCARCNTPKLQGLLKEQGNRLLAHGPTAQKRGQELLTISTESAQFPSLWEWLIKKVEILATETTALEQARFNTPACNCRQVKKLEYLYQKSDQA